MKILIVEDDPVLSELLREYLQQLEHERVQVCLTARDAFVAIKEDIYDCAFIDLRLPDMDGLRLLEIIKNQDPSLPIVMMSGYPTMVYTIEAMRKGASDFLTKPFTLQDMALALERVTKERKLLLENLSLKLECQAREQLEIVNRELEQKVQEQTKLFQISGEIDGIRSSEDLYPCIVNLASRLTDTEKAAFFILPPDQNDLMLISGQGIGGELQSGIIHQGGEGVKNALNSTDSTHMVLPAEAVLDAQRLQSCAMDNTMLSCWPLKIRGELFGFLATCENGRTRSLPQTEVKLLDFLMKKSALAIENMALYESMINNFYAILKSLVNALEAKDLYTGKHSERVTRYAVKIAGKMQLNADETEALRTIGYLHDIGKIGIADGILNKPGSLTGEEYELVKKHPVIGESIVAELGLSPDERAIIRHHHERWDGRGYPDGLVRDETPLLARIVVVADAFDAMTSKRAYRDAMSMQEAVSELVRNRAKQFDSDVVDAFIEAVEKPTKE